MAFSETSTPGRVDANVSESNAGENTRGRPESAVGDTGRRRHAQIVSVGLATPRYSVENPASSALAQQLSCSNEKQARRVDALYRKTAIKQRGSVLLEATATDQVANNFYPPPRSPGDRGPTTRDRSDRFAIEAPVLATASASDALHQSGLGPEQITHLIVVTCTGFSAPGIDIELMGQLGLPATTQRIQVGFMGCHGAINGLRVARGIVAAEPDAKVLLCSVELCSLHYQYGYDPNRIVSGAIFSDGSASLILKAGDGPTVCPGEPQGQRRVPEKKSQLDGVTAACLAGYGIGRVTATGSYLVPDSRDDMTWRVGDNGFEMTLSAKVPGLIQHNLRGYLASWLRDQGESIQSISGWAVHPGGSRILTATQTALGLTDDQLAISHSVLRQHGNMSSATMLFILSRFAQAQQPKPWLMLGFGPGLEIEVALIR